MLPAPLRTATVPFVERLGSFGDRVALVAGAETLSYAELADRVRARAEQLGTGRRLVLVAGANRVDPLVTYLAALSAGHPAILVPGDNPTHIDSLVTRYDPDVVVDGTRFEERRAGSAHDLHPDLALLLTTSGSTGSPKLVRLSHENLQSNAESIAAYLEIRPTDRAVTTLPMHYCYGLSVINSHLLAGGGVVLTELSVVDACFWDLFREQRCTTFAGVPYTFDLLDRVGFDRMDLPHLRYLTQAGGRLAPDRVRRYAELGQRHGWDLFVMYGQTEATARMAYLPPDLAKAHPTAIGVPIPGGSFTLEPLPERPLSTDGTVETGELVYRGDNVMLGYAEEPADLALGRCVTELRTGDVARRTQAGMYEIVGRRNRFAKIFGLRIDLDQVEAVFAGEGLTACCAAVDDRLVVAVEGSHVTARVQELARRDFGLPRGAVRVVETDELPRLPTGKPDYRAVAGLPDGGPGVSTLRQAQDTGRSTGVRELYAELLGRDDVTDDDSFVTLDGDSLSYVEVSIRLEEQLGHLPANWHTMPVRELVPAAPGTRRRRGRTVETNVLLRALAIVLIVGTHGNLFSMAGGAHLLLGVSGYNFGRFLLSGAPQAERVKHMIGSTLRIVVPSVLWIGLVTVLAGGYGWQNALLLNALLGPEDWAEPQWYYWFIEALVYTLVALTAFFAVPAVDRLERRWSFWLPIALACLGLLTRYELVVLRGGDVIHRAHIVFWLFALGWATVKATSNRHRLVVSALVAATVPGFFDDPVREAMVLAGMLLLVWVRQLRVPAYVARAGGVLASASLYIYLAHWQIYPHFEDHYPALALTLSLAGGIAFWQCATRTGELSWSRVRMLRRPQRRRAAR